MKSNRPYIYATLLSMPIIGILYYLLHPPQCPQSYTQEQVDVSGCIVGANIGGTFIFIVVAMVNWLAAVWLVRKFANKKDSV